MKFLKVDKLESAGSDVIFKIAKMAFEAKLQGHKVYNATLGSLYNEDGTMTIHSSFYSHYDQLNRQKKAAYTPAIDGGEAFKETVKNWVFKTNNFLKKAEVIATPGGSGALSLAFSTLLNENEIAILPDIYWGPYDFLLSTKGLKSVKCEVFKNGEFMLDNIVHLMKEVAKTQSNVVVIINDPCHNPTGYSMTLNQWDQLIQAANEVAQGDTTVTIINDIAYLDYSKNYAHSRDYQRVFEKINDNVMVVFAFSGSKTFTAYGMRIGAAIVYANNEEDIQNTWELMNQYARGTWSNVNTGAVNTLVEILSEPSEFENDLNNASQMLAERSEIFIKEANRVGLQLYPTTEGFFVTLVGIEGKNQLIFDKLVEQHIYVVPLKKGIRIALCSLSKQDCAEVPEKIQAVIEEVMNAK